MMRNLTVTLLLTSYRRKNVIEQYKVLDERLSNFDFFEPLFIQNDIVKVPGNRKKRYQWYENLAIIKKVNLYVNNVKYFLAFICLFVEFVLFIYGFAFLSFNFIVSFFFLQMDKKRHTNIGLT